MTTTRMRLAASLSVAAMMYCISAVAAEPLPKTDAAPPAVASPLKPVETPKPLPHLEEFKPGTKIDNALCLKCHDTIKTSKIKPGHHAEDCIACHTPKANRATPCGRGEASFPQAEQCLACHKKDPKLLNWKFSEHSKAGGKCTDCHEMHTPTADKKSSPLIGEKMQKDTTTCVKCHQDVTSRLNMTSHHPVKEGGLTCVNCHNPHDSNKTLLKSKSEQCLSCHQAVRGPMAFEHAPVVEDCLSCHTPHGSPNRKLLSVSQPAVCLQCHSIAQGKHGYATNPALPEPALTSGTRTISGAVLRNCTACHGAIHGSHQDPLLRY